MFNKSWFQKHQKLLLWFANTSIGRYIFSINGKKSSVGKNKIIKIEPNSITWLVKKGKRKVTLSIEFRTHNKFSKRLYYTFKPIWHLFHVWDTFFANNFQPTWNLGFDTLTVYPNADAESTSVDGYAGPINKDVSWTSLRGQTGNDQSDSGTGLFLSAQGSATSNQYQKMYRVATLFDTSALTTSATISAATYSLYYNNLLNGLGGLASAIVTCNPASNTAITGTDYGTFTTTRQASDIAYASISNNAYNDFALNATGLSNISKTAITKFGNVFANDIDDSAPTWASNATSQNGSASADTAGTSNDPKLVVTYTVPSSGFFALL